MQSIEAYPLNVRIANAVVSYFTYLVKMIWPRDLAVFYPYQWSWPLWQVLGIVFLFVAVTFVVIGTARRFPYLSVGWLWYLGTLVPVIGIAQVGLQARADRYTYIPLIGMFIMIAWGVPEFLKQWRYRKEALLATSTCILSCLFIVTWTQVGYWQNSMTLFERALKVTDNNYLAYFSLGEVYSARGDQRQAIENYDRSIEINQKYAAAYYNRGNAYAALGNHLQAIAYNNRGNAYLVLGNERQAVNNYDKAIEINPNYAEAYSNRGIAYRRLGDQKQALEDVKTAARLGNEVAQNILRKLGVNW